MYIFQELKKKMTNSTWKDNLIANKKYMNLYVKKTKAEQLAKNINKQIR